uniref:Uncharacterized protein n=1 Tax=Caulerpa lentillifera TaxID=148947 RepID=A0A2Z2QKG8_9CHLO|nr:hypothetical protein [Caulerpa lentillifera]AST24234.1 hypothetical protein [Caulerpa lentillifera]
MNWLCSPFCACPPGGACTAPSGTDWVCFSNEIVRAQSANSSGAKAEGLGLYTPPEGAPKAEGRGVENVQRSAKGPAPTGCGVMALGVQGPILRRPITKQAQLRWAAPSAQVAAAPSGPQPSPWAGSRAEYNGPTTRTCTQPAGYHACLPL